MSSSSFVLLTFSSSYLVLSSSSCSSYSYHTIDMEKTSIDMEGITIDMEGISQGRSMTLEADVNLLWNEFLRALTFIVDVEWDLTYYHLVQLVWDWLAQYIRMLHRLCIGENMATVVQQWITNLSDSVLLQLQSLRVISGHDSLHNLLHSLGFPLLWRCHEFGHCGLQWQ